MGISVTPNFPQAFCADGTLVGATIVQIIPPYFALALVKSVNLGYLDTEWLEIQTTGTDFLQADIDAAGGPLQYIEANAASVETLAAQTLGANAPAAGWVSQAYNPPTQAYDPVQAMAFLVAIYGSESPKPGTPLYEKIVPFRNWIIFTANPLQVSQIIANTWAPTCTGMTAAQLVAYLDSEDNEAV